MSMSEYPVRRGFVTGYARERAPPSSEVSRRAEGALMVAERCCVCGRQGEGLVVLFEGHALRGPSVSSCPQHSRQQVVCARDVFVRLRDSEVGYYRQHLENPAAVVWASRALAQLDDQHTRALLPDGLPVLMVVGEASPEVYSVGRFLALILGLVVS